MKGNQLACSLMVALLALPAWPAVPVLTLLNWPTYLDPALVAEFEQAQGVRVRQVLFETDMDRDTLMAESNGEGFDLVLVDGGSVASYIKQGWLQPLRPQALPNLGRVDEVWRKAYEGAWTHGMPYTWGTLGIAYRRDLVARPVRSWMDLFRPAAAQRGHIMMYDDPKELIACALLALGRPPGAAEPADLAAAEALLQEQRPAVREYSALMTSAESQLLTGEIHLAQAYNGDAQVVAELNTNVVFVNPEEGGAVFCDYWCVSSRAAQPEWAHRLLDFLNEPARAARAARSVRFATPNRDAEKLLPPAYLLDPAIYPPPACLEKCDFFRAPKGRAIARYNEIFIRLTRTPGGAPP